MNGSIVRAISTLAGWRQRQLCGVTVLAACLTVASGTVFAAAQVSGSPQDVSVEAQNSSIQDVLSALGEKFNLQLQSSANLNKQITGTYRGSLRRVVSRLLVGYNFIIRSDHDRLEVTVIGTQTGPGRTAPSTGFATKASASVAVAPVAAPPSPVAVHSPPPALPAAKESSPNSRIAEAQHRGAAASAPTATPTPAGTPTSAAPAPTPPFRVAEGPSASGPTPTAPDPSMKGPVLGPATSSMPMPTPSTTPMPRPTPTPGSTASSGALSPTLGGPTPFPLNKATTGEGPNATSAPTTPAPTNPAPSTLTPSTAK
jgi:hypothetical protein